MNNKQEMLKMQTWVLRVNIQCRCDGCKKKIRKLLQKIDGVYSIQVNAEQGKVTVTGNVDPAKLIKKLEKSGKHAEVWGPQKGSNNHYQNLLDNFKNMQIDTGKGGGGGGKDSKSQKGGGKGQHGQHQNQPQQQMQQFKGSNNMKMTANKMDQKSVRFNTHEDNFNASDEDLDDEFDDYDDEFDEDFEDDEEEFGQGHQLPPNKFMPMKGNNGNGPHGHFGMTNRPGFNDKKGGGGGGGNGKKGGGGGAIEIPVVMKGKGGNNDGKNGNNGKKGKGGQGKDGKNNSSGKDKKQDAKDKTGGKTKSGRGGLLGFLRRSKSGREVLSDEYDFCNNDIVLGGGKNNGNGTKKGRGGKNEGFHHDEIGKMKQGFQEFDGNGGGPWNMGQMGKMNQMAPIGHMGQMGGNYGRMGDMRAVQGLPAQTAMNSGAYYQGMGMGMGPGNHPYYQQPQYMAMLMNQQRQNGNDMYQPMMYAPPHPAVNYMPPPMPPPPIADPLTHIFSDENTGSCSIM